MKSLKSLAPLTIALVIAFVLLSLNHLLEFASTVVQAWFAIKVFQWAITSIKSTSATPSSSVESEEIQLEEVIDNQQLVQELIESQEHTSSDLVFQIEADEHCLLGTVDKSTDASEMKTEPKQSIKSEVETPLAVQIPAHSVLDDFIKQLETLPQKQGKRLAWQKLCTEFGIQGGKVRDANVNKRAQFLIDKGILLPDLIKAKVKTLTLAAA